MPEVLRTFVAGDWQEWPLDGPDPAQESRKIPLADHYDMPHPMVVEDFRGTAFPTTTRLIMVGIGNDPERVARDRYDDAYKRWTEARRAWLKANVGEDAALDFWIDAISERHRARNSRRLPIGETGRPHGW